MLSANDAALLLAETHRRAQRLVRGTDASPEHASAARAAAVKRKTAQSERAPACSLIQPTDNLSLVIPHITFLFVHAKHETRIKSALAAVHDVATSAPGLKDGGNLRSVTIPGNPGTSPNPPPLGTTLYTAVAVSRCHGRSVVAWHRAGTAGRKWGSIHFGAETFVSQVFASSVTSYFGFFLTMCISMFALHGNLAFTASVGNGGNYNIGPSYITVINIRGGPGGRPKVQLYFTLIPCCVSATTASVGRQR